ncbi:MAG TPA: DUF6438 domain-containing protein [Vicinamibacterales bacterium]|jgi:hypothetical protein
MKTSAVALLAALSAGPAFAQETVRITLERTPCFGRCPVYTVTIADDGRVTYDGRQFVRVDGAHEWRIDRAAVRALAAEIEKAGFFEMKDEYTALITDHPTTYTEVAIGNRHKRIKDYVSGPAALKEIEKRIDDVSGVARYVSADPAREVRGKDDGLEAALARGDAATVRALLAAGADPRARDDRGVTLVMKAAMSGDPETLRAVLVAGGDPTARDFAGRNAADRARDLLARDSHNPHLAEILRLLTDE